MDAETEQKLTFMARQIAAEMCRNPAGQLVPVSTAVGAMGLQACGTLMPSNGCEGMLYAPITTQRFYRSGRTDIDVILEGLIPVVPGSAVLQAPTTPQPQQQAPARQENPQRELLQSFLRDAESALEKNQFDKAKAFVESAERIDPRNTAVGAMKRRISEREMSYMRSGTLIQ